MIGIAYMVGKPEQVYLDKRWKGIMGSINEALPETINAVSSCDKAETICVVVASNSTQPARYYLYDFKKNTLEWLADSRPWLIPSQMAEMQTFEFNARDGMKMHGYLTVPKGSDGKNLPMVINPHGGPGQGMAGVTAARHNSWPIGVTRYCRSTSAAQPGSA